MTWSRPECNTEQVHCAEFLCCTIIRSEVRTERIVMTPNEYKVRKKMPNLESKIGHFE